MEWITIADWPGGDLATFEELHGAHGDPDGIVARYVGTIPNALRVLAVWESKAAAEQFFATLPSTSATRLAPASNGVPTVSAFAAEHSYSGVSA